MSIWRVAIVVRLPVVVRRLGIGMLQSTQKMQKL